MLSLLKEYDAAVQTIRSGAGTIIVSPGLQGRIFCEVDGTFVHRLDEAILKNPDPVEFNNFGGNSLWPAPEGGAYAYNYLADGKWTVQPAMNRQPAQIIMSTAEQIEIAKDMQLSNRRGADIALRFFRRITPADIRELLNGYQLRGVAYCTDESLVPLAEYKLDDVVVSAWSLEQLPDADGVIAFGRVNGAVENCINADFYGNPHSRLSYYENGFRFELGAADRLQIGIKADSQPELIGSYNPARNMLVVRYTPVRHDGRYINIADNDQPAGVYFAADQFSIFNGATLGFHELETIAPMNSERGRLTGSRLQSTTIILQGKADQLKRCLHDFFKVTFVL
ncbi:MAG: DUF6786 family protein [Kiritimatiellales bacterium]